MSERIDRVLRGRKLTITFIAFVVSFAIGSTSVLGIPSMYQRCEVGGNCTLGEFIFYDNFNPIPLQICTLDVSYPNETLWMDDINMDNHSDGWHDYTINLSTDTPEGRYRTLMCCDDNGDLSCIDKSFIVGASFETLETGLSGWEQGIIIGISVIAFLFFFLAKKVDNTKLQGVSLQILFLMFGFFTILAGLNIMALIATDSGQTSVANIINGFYGPFLLIVIFVIAYIIISFIAEVGLTISKAGKDMEDE